MLTTAILQPNFADITDKTVTLDRLRIAVGFYRENTWTQPVICIKSSLCLETTMDILQNPPIGSGAVQGFCSDHEKQNNVDTL